MTVKEFMDSPDKDYGQFYGKCTFDGKKDFALVHEFKTSLVNDILFELKARGFEVEIDSIEEEVESIMGVVSGLIHLYNQARTDDIPDSDFQRIWTPTDQNDWEKAIKSKNGLLYFRPCSLFYEDPNNWIYADLEFPAFSIEFND